MRLAGILHLKQRDPNAESFYILIPRKPPPDLPSISMLKKIQQFFATLLQELRDFFSGTETPTTPPAAPPVPKPPTACFDDPVIDPAPDFEDTPALADDPPFIVNLPDHPSASPMPPAYQLVPEKNNKPHPKKRHRKHY